MSWQIPLTINDFYEFLTTLNNIIDIEYEGKDKDSQDVYRFTCLNNGKYTILEATSNKNRSLTIDTMWKAKEKEVVSQLANANNFANALTSEMGNDSNLNNNIS